MVFIIMSDIVSLKDRGKYQGIIEGAIAIANGIGPVLGAVFAEKASWRVRVLLPRPSRPLLQLTCGSTIKVVLLDQSPALWLGASAPGRLPTVKEDRRRHVSKVQSCRLRRKLRLARSYGPHASRSHLGRYRVSMEIRAR